MREVVRLIKTPLTMLALLALVVVGGLWGWTNATAQIPPRQLEPCVATDVGGKLAPGHVTVRVLNAGLRGGLAKRVSTNLRSYGFFILRVNNAEVRHAETVIVGNAPDSPEVRLIAGFFKNAKISGDGRADHVVDVLLGDEYQGMVLNPKTSLPVSGPVCLPKLPASENTVIPTATPSAKATPSKSPTKK
ncbi:MAG: LytR C-terminal domain-containing protein [Micropruina sp.]|nr:LytR C-terminal domain-containing protein [Micropruina sp.]